MLKKILGLGILLCLVSFAFAQEEKITITTYYPSPYGSYNELRSTRMAIGKDWYSGANVCWEDDLYCTGSSKIPADSWDPDTDLVVQGSVGIGTTSPAATAKLDVNGGIRVSNTLRAARSAAGDPFMISDGGWSGSGGLDIGHASGYSRITFWPGSANEVMRITSTGNVGIGDTTPASLLTIGSGDLFQVDSSGNIVKIRDIAYSWPSTQGAANTLLRNNGSGTLSWAAPAGGIIGNAKLSCGGGNCVVSGSGQVFYSYNGRASVGTYPLSGATPQSMASCGGGGNCVVSGSGQVLYSYNGGTSVGAYPLSGATPQ